MAFRKPEDTRKEAVELGGELSEAVLKAKDITVLVEAIKMMSENTRESLKKALEMTEL